MTAISGHHTKVHCMEQWPQMRVFLITSPVLVLGSNNVRNDSGVLTPVWECFVDGTHINTINPTPAVEEFNNWPLCAHETLVDGPHSLTMNVASVGEQTFWFDRIQFVPSAAVPLDTGKTVLIDNVDPQLQAAHGTGWVPFNSDDLVNMTKQMNSTFTLNFTGVSLSWYGILPLDLSIKSTTGTYAVDGKASMDFLLGALPPEQQLYNAKIFETEQLFQGEHQIIVSFQGYNQTTPLTLDYLLVQNGTTTSTLSVTPTVTSTSAATSSGTQNNPHRISNAGFIALSVSLVVVLITLVIYGLCHYNQRRRIRYVRRKEGLLTPIDLVPRPFTYSPPVFIDYSTKTNRNRFVLTASRLFDLRSNQRPNQPNVGRLARSETHRPQADANPGHVHYKGQQDSHPNPNVTLRSMDVIEELPPQYTSTAE